MESLRHGVPYQKTLADSTARPLELKYDRVIMKWTVLSDNRSSNPMLETEHGLSILLQTER